MQKYNTDITQVLKWMQNKAPAISSIINQKADWYRSNHEQFWENWKSDVFDLRTAKPFGLVVWCIILGVPSSLFGFYTNVRAWAYGEKRQNFVYSGDSQYEGFEIPAQTDPYNIVLPLEGTSTVSNPNTIGGNFVGGGSTTLLTIEETRYVLMLRYAALVSNGQVMWINRMLRHIFNDGEPWDYDAKKYFYLADSTIVGGDSVSPITNQYYMEYRLGAAIKVSGQFIELLNDPQYGIMPSCCGIKYKVVQES
ncbi:hypothetical protein CPT_MyoSmar_056 [Serratia phage MyoSmar]|uniref:Structural protein n=4 Tax=Myosmarvirus TaxID=2843428 RepID=A0A9E8G0D6_9CAUD|nr:hypothetical protein HWC56_gp056 [Serratia phage MyoSmar]QEG09505.1 hypothetical protein CPT_MyoSmar_056 [Serratia phage MyoSmar]UZS00339.1 putative structural protein [Serratia phage SMP]